jgi:hypothetical protein
MKKEELNISNHMAVEKTRFQNLTIGTVKQKVTSSFGPDLVTVTPRSKESLQKEQAYLKVMTKMENTANFTVPGENK